jgi:hypothetical protein
MRERLVRTAQDDQLLGWSWDTRRGWAGRRWPHPHCSEQDRRREAHRSAPVRLHVPSAFFWSYGAQPVTGGRVGTGPPPCVLIGYAVVRWAWARVSWWLVLRLAAEAPTTRVAKTVAASTTTTTIAPTERERRDFQERSDPMCERLTYPPSEVEWTQPYDLSTL